MSPPYHEDISSNQWFCFRTLWCALCKSVYPPNSFVFQPTALDLCFGTHHNIPSICSRAHYPLARVNWLLRCWGPVNLTPSTFIYWDEDFLAYRPYSSLVLCVISPYIQFWIFVFHWREGPIQCYWRSCRA